MAGKVQRSQTETALQVSPYDRVAGLLIAGLFLSTFVVATMLVVWLSNRSWQPMMPVAVNVIPKDVGGGGDGSGMGPRPAHEDFDEPGGDETPPEKVDTSLEAIVSTIDSPDVVAQLTTGVLSSSVGNTPGEIGRGPRRGPSVGDGPLDGIATWERWEIGLNAATLEDYSQQLDFFQIELGVAGGGSPHVTYLSQLTKTKPQIRTGSPQAEKRLRFMHRSGALRDADRQLARQAGVDPAGKVVFQFYSPETHATLLALEHAAKGERHIREVRRTIFGVKQVGDKYEFYVVSQEYR
jgi:hypothetical protein